MNIQIRTINCEIDAKTKEYIIKKVGKIKKFLNENDILNCDVEINMDSKHHQKGEIYTTEISIQLPKKLLIVKKTEKDLIKAIDKTQDHLARSIVKYKEKTRGQKRKQQLNQ